MKKITWETPKHLRLIKKSWLIKKSQKPRLNVVAKQEKKDKLDKRS